MRVGTIGSGFIVRTILDRISRTEGIECGAVYSRSLEKGKALAADFGVETVYTDLEQMFSDETLDFIYVASPNSLHYAQTKMALEYGKNVLCEKPLVPYAAQAEELVALAKSKGLFLFEGITTLYHPNFAWIKEHMPDLGTLKMITATYCQYSSRYDTLMEGKQTNIFDPAFATGSLMDINVYNVYFIAALLGQPDSVQYFPGIHPNGIDTHGTLILRYGEVVCQCVGAKDTFCDNTVQIMGTDGYMRVSPTSSNCDEVTLVRRTIHDMGPNSVNSREKGKDREEISLSEDQWLYEMQTLSQIVARKDYDLCYRNLETACIVADILEKARKSANLCF